MFGLSFEKLFLVAIVAAVVIGPSRLPAYTRQLTEWLRSLKQLVETTKSQAEREWGGQLTRAEWEALDPRQFDPRRIVKEAMKDPDAEQVSHADLLDEAARIRPGQKYLVGGSAAHPQRIAIASLPDDDPRRIAARGTMNG